MKIIFRKNINKLVVGHLNIKSKKNKLWALIQNVSLEIDLLTISEGKIHQGFLKSQFLIKGFSDPFRTDWNIHLGDIILYVREDIPAKFLSLESISSKCFFIEFKLRKQKWLISCPYNPHENNTLKQIEILSKNLYLYSSQYENNIIIRGFNVGVSNPHMNGFCNAYNLSSLIKEPTCCKNQEIPSWQIHFIANNKFTSYLSRLLRGGDRYVWFS